MTMLIKFINLLWNINHYQIINNATIFKQSVVAVINSEQHPTIYELES